MDKGISVTQTFRLLKKKAGFIISLCLTGVMIAWLITTYLVTPQYTSTTKMLVNYTQTSELLQQSDIDINLQLINTYKDIIENPVILNDVQEALNMEVGSEELTDKIEISSKENSQIFAIHVTDESPIQAAAIANTIADTFQTKIGEIMNVENVTIISEAIPYTQPVSPNVLLNVTVGLLLGLLISIGKIFIDEFTDNTIKSESFITEELGWLSLGQINELDADQLAVKKQDSELGTTTHSTSVKSRV